jgi:hypothetical protein
MTKNNHQMSCHESQKAKYCPICFKELSHGGIYHHIKNIHATTMKQIKRTSPNDKKKLN